METVFFKNLVKLKRTRALENFVEKYCGQWNHQQWLRLCDLIQLVLGPVDPEEMGQLLEEKKREYFQKRDSTSPS